jgi:hypothetical protein
MSERVEALVVGAGISGLATAYALQKAGIATRVVESAARPGGVIQSVKRGGYLLECGPQSFSGNSAISAMCRDLGILEERVLADPKAPRYVLIDEKLQKVPMGLGLLTSSFMSGGTRTAILRDIFGKSGIYPPQILIDAAGPAGRSLRFRHLRRRSGKIKFTSGVPDPLRSGKIRGKHHARRLQSKQATQGRERHATAGAKGKSHAADISRWQRNADSRYRGALRGKIDLRHGGYSNRGARPRSGAQGGEVPREPARAEGRRNR